ncbi:tRNA1(Val) (adenine(37)-N6)-methyltransferase [Fusibacter sp. JL216-2]|uniref:tRNA1(Val) (adenine(37)-N6)-methyltransferase n=1 Tax=Fusibacter sp. JL216-2 TaxID=3071453 RepID=UPI003D32ECF7
MNEYVKPHERVDDLQIDGLKIIQNPKGFCFGIDAVLVSNFARVKKGSRVVDLGTGTGIIPLLVSAKSAQSKISAFEIQEDVADMARRSVAMNGLEDRIEIIEDNIINALDHLGKHTVDVVISNPPYMASGVGEVNPSDHKAISRHEIHCTLEDIISTASALLRGSGQFFMVHRPNRLVDILTLCRAHNLEPKRIRFVHPFAGKSPNIVLIHATKGGRPDVKVLEPLVVRNDDQSYTEEIYEIYRQTNISSFERREKNG